MKKISQKVYATLTPTQRVAAYVEALARGDEDEVQRLRSSCPRVEYRRIDPRFTIRLDTLFALAMATEADLKESALGFFVAMRLDPTKARDYLQQFANTRHAWQTILSTFGVDAKAMQSVGPPSSPFFEFIDPLIPKPDEEASRKLSSEMLRFLD
ncbi:hypothetical protein [Marivita geojedonensis]|uniref:Uncharacterized protein n=1 Tax=Marivita geojedonensis TaxID=1123756 RepID=A0A1X4NDP1_9RHOB|nr:hypothetical protein [Marivita geojedonensis]OSQ44938.1 hypothetical protein MGEO_18520 [Marivita geojedonensis]PRY73847.1 hypothetical protein CLV76_12726 [Marivita geojedonensis]